jgi:HAMP domain-containing protein
MICLVALAGSFFYIYYATRRLMRPLRTLQEAMDETSLDNLDNPRRAPQRGRAEEPQRGVQPPPSALGGAVDTRCAPSG